MSYPEFKPVALTIPDGAGGSNTIVFDACITESHTLTNTLTDHPVENGANIVDHSRPEPRTVTLDFIVSNSPLVIFDKEGTVIDSSPPVGDYAGKAWGEMVGLHESPKLCSLVTVRDFYPSMGLTSVTSPVDVKNAQSFRATASFKQVRVVQNRFVQLVPVADSKGQRKNNRGAINTTPTTDIDPLRTVAGAFGVK